MAGDNLARIRPVSLREAWTYEDLNFTPWLAENLDELGDALGVSLELQGQEVSVGAKKLDIFATDRDDGRPVIIENQLEPTDDNHLGRLLIYAAGKDAKLVVWVAREILDEHRQVLDWLNQRTDENTQFYGVVVELWKIDDSRPAPHFKVVATPNDWRKENISAPPPQVSGSHQRNIEFRMQLAEKLEREHNIKVISGRGTKGAWCVVEYPVRGTRIGTGWGKGIGVDIGINSKQASPRVSQNFATRRADIESMILNPAGGESLEWGITETGGEVVVSRPGNIYDNPQLWGEYQDWIIDKLVKFRAELKAAAGDGG